MTLTAGSLFSGYGGLSLAVEQAMGATTRWVSDVEPAANAVLARRFPDATNLGDITTIDWATVEPVDIIEGGSPCQDVSTAGRRAGMTEGTRSNLWVAMREAIRVIEPRFVIWENVAGALSAHADSDLEPCPGCMGDTGHGGPALRALGRVLADLSELGFNTEWVTVRASDVGACHQRARVFVLAWRPERVGAEGRRAEGVEVAASPAGAGVFGRADRGSDGLSLLPTPRTSDTNGAGVHGQGGIDLRTAVAFLPTPTATPYGTQKGLNPELLLPGVAKERSATADWGKYGPAIERHAHMLGRPHPAPTITGTRGNPKLSAHFTEWVMCAPDGWIGDLVDDGTITNNAGLKLSGNGVVIPQAVYAIQVMLARADLTGRAAA